MLSIFNCYFIFLIVCLLIFLPGTIAINYCDSNVCDNSKQHTLCKFRTPGPGPHCFGYQRTVTTEEQKHALLDKINSRRNKIAVGDLRSFPPAENMLRLVWNEELEQSAQRWADQCVTQGADAKDVCRDLMGTAVGQNIASVYGDAPGLSPLSLVDVWYMELLNTNSSVLPRYRLSSQDRGFMHYDYFTQLVWARSSEVGCGGIKFQELLKSTQGGRNRTVHRLVCNFAPAGNVLGEPVYSEGPPCSRCPDSGSCDLEYTALCSTQLHRNTRYAMTADVKEYSTPSTNNDDQMFLLNEESSMENITNISEAPDNDKDDDNITIFDYFSHLYEYTRQPVTRPTTKVTNSCKDALAVDDLVELLKKKLTNDSKFKELLLSTKNPAQNVDYTFSDPSVAAFVSRIYSKKEPTTTTKLPDSDYVNSTLLVDLVEAVIFRSAERTHATEETIETLQPSSVGPIKIQAELGEVNFNQEFTGHYFFPEDVNEDSASGATDVYYDTSDLPVSDVISEIESYKRDKTTQDFLDDIIDGDSGIDESTTTLNTVTFDDLNGNGERVMKKFLNEMGDQDEK